MKTAISIACALSLAGCAMGGSVQLDAARGDAAAWAALDAVAVTLDQMALSKALKGPTAATAAADLTKAQAALMAADAAYKVADGATAADDINSAMTLIGELVSLSHNPGT